MLLRSHIRLLLRRPTQSLIGLSIFAAVIYLFIALSAIGSPLRTYAFLRQADPVEGGYPYMKPEGLSLEPPKPKTLPWKAPPRVLVAAHPSTMNLTSFLPDLLPQWNISSQPIPQEFLNMRIDHESNKGRTANAYLTFIIENYYNLPETMVFLDANFNDWDNEKTVQRLQSIASLRTDFVQKEGYTNLHCGNAKDCKTIETSNPPDELRTLEVHIAQVWREVFDVVEPPHKHVAGNVPRQPVEVLVYHQEVPKKLAAVLGGDFAVSRAQVKTREVADYMRLWKWINHTDMDDDSAGLLMEYLWPVVFGKSEVFCEEQKVCLCGLYGRC